MTRRTIPTIKMKKLKPVDYKKVKDRFTDVITQLSLQVSDVESTNGFWSERSKHLRTWLHSYQVPSHGIKTLAYILTSKALF